MYLGALEKPTDHDPPLYTIRGEDGICWVVHAADKPHDVAQQLFLNPY